MLPRAALLRRNVVPSLRTSQLFQLRTYAKAGRPPPPPPPHSSRPQRPAKSGQPTSPASGATRQTSPGTSIPKDQTWKPKDSIKFSGRPPTATPSATASVVGAGTAAATTASGAPVGGFRSQDEAVLQHPLQHEFREHEPIAQTEDRDQTPVGGQRNIAQEKEAASENTIPPPESLGPEEIRKSEAENEEPAATGPLPDLRQGIPSTFDFEFGKKLDKETASTEKPSQQNDIDGIDITSASREETSGSGSGKERTEKEYNQADYETSMDKRRAQMANYLYAFIATFTVVGGMYLARPFRVTEEVPPDFVPENADGWQPDRMWQRVRARFRSQADYYTEPTFPKLLPEIPKEQRPLSGMTLVLSLEDLMIHSSWDRENGYRIAKRPGIDYFIRYLVQYYELVLFTSAPSVMADPVYRKMDPYHLIQWPLYREATKYEKGNYVKDLSYLNRDLKKTIIIDTSDKHVSNQPENAIVLPKWKGDPKDPHTKDLVSLIPFLENLAMSGTQDVREVLKGFEGKDIPAEFSRREVVAREKFLASQSSSSRRGGIMGSLAGGLGIAGGSGLVGPDGKPLESGSEAIARGKTWSDQIRERGQMQYEILEKRIQEEGPKWLAEEAAAEKAFMENQAKEMKKSTFNWFGMGGEKKE
ncbi:hypothetical protein K431DRAFT_289658 [Polychaeton citri CBS 116435]|uniref:Mitochondrial import inner membrane translocase subunit TIM50 n=1 Tax=Polychaeton citri CBS 116435 TaxID=1314669 RepID=A0A9P4UJ98_9PEZI|nr:hypothetical protein K431DRAFT_289658 [Polychaeton citri CBS 116435]